MLSIDDMPDVEVHILQSPEAPTGVSDTGVPPIGRMGLVSDRLRFSLPVIPRL